RQDTLENNSFITVINGVFERKGNFEILQEGKVTEIYQTGELRSEYSIKVGSMKSGFYRSYYGNRQVNEIISYYNGKRIDEYFSLHPNGNIACVGNYSSILEDSLFIEECDTTNYVDSLTMEPFSLITCEVKSFKNGEWKYFDEKGT